MRFIVFKIHICGMSSKTLSRKIMIDKPFKTINKFLSLKYCIQNNIVTTNDLISYIKKTTDKLSIEIGDFGLENFSIDNIYIKHKGYLIGLQHDKNLSDVFDYFKKSIVEFNYIYVAGGASREHHGYTFIIRSNEERHRNMPHVHVQRDNVAPRYLLSTLERITADKYLPEHLRDEKKIIKPYIKNNIKWFNEKWAMSMNGYIPPSETETGLQFCKES